MGPDLTIGLLSGTSVDGVDAALVDHSAGYQLISTHSEPFSARMRQQIIDLCSSGNDEIERMGVLDRQLGAHFANAVKQLLSNAGVPPSAVRAIGSHGQTIRHRPTDATREVGDAFSWQIGDPNTIAEITGIATVADFRRRDIAAGGQGAPLVPVFHQAAFANKGCNRAIVNIGGMSNVSILQRNTGLSGFDTGPGNVLLDTWSNRHLRTPYDDNGAWSATGQVNMPLLETMLSHPFFALPAPKSTGREDFNSDWLDQILAGTPVKDPADVQASLVELSARSIADSLSHSEAAIEEVYVCGGGAFNGQLMARLASLLENCKVSTTTELGIEPQWVEASAFAWLAWRCLQGLSGNDARVTGAAGARILGGIYPA